MSEVSNRPDGPGDRPPWADRAHLFAVAGLLHDCGKLLEVAGTPLPSDIERMQEQVCPVFDGLSSHRHVLHSLHAVEQARTDWGGLPAAQVRDLVAYHHRPRTDVADDHLVVVADRLASGHDRRRHGESDATRVTALRPVTAAIRISGEAKPAAGEWHVPTGELAFADVDRFLPVKGAQTFDAFRAASRPLADLLLKHLNGDHRTPEWCTERLLALMHRLTHALPQSRSRDETPDTTLFDHSRVVAAFAACLAVQFGADAPADQALLRRDARFRMVGIRLRGIQDFIFRAVPRLEDPGTGQVIAGARGMARTLRAKSFYLSMLTMAFSRRLLAETGLPATNILIDAGGRCFILIPDTDAVVDRARRALSAIRAWTRDTLLGSIQVDAMIGPSLGADAFSAEAFRSTWDETTARLERQRFQPPFDGMVGADGAWREDGWVDHRNGLPVDGDDVHRQFIELGKRLPTADRVAVARASAHRRDGAGLTFHIAGMDVSIIGSRDDTPEQAVWFRIGVDRAAPASEPFVIIANHVPIATAEDICELDRTRKDDTDREADVPVDEAADDEAARVNAPLTFSHLARLARRDPQDTKDQIYHTHRMLGTLKADVDRLGQVMSRGLRGDVQGVSALSFGRLCALSRALDLFFKGFLDGRLRRDYPHVYTVFAGGDDLFLVGPWSDIVRLTQALHGWFGRFTCGNSELTFSAGIVFTHPSAPVRTLAVLGEDALGASKDGGRNRVTVGSLTMAWDAFSKALNLSQALLDPRAEINRSLLHRLFRYGCWATEVVRWKTQQGTAGSAAPGAEKMRWRSQLSYDLRRNFAFADHADGREKERDIARRSLHSQLCEGSARADLQNGMLQFGAMMALYARRGSD